MQEQGDAVLAQVSTPMALVVGALTLSISYGVEAQPVLGADPPEVAVQPLDGPQENEEGGLLRRFPADPGASPEGFVSQISPLRQPLHVHPGQGRDPAQPPSL